MYIAEICSEKESHAKTAIEINGSQPDSQADCEVQNGRWLIEDLQEDLQEDYTVRVMTVLDGKTICLSCKNILQDEDGIFDKLSASNPNKASCVEPESLTLDLGLEMTQTV